MTFHLMLGKQRCFSSHRHRLLEVRRESAIAQLDRPAIRRDESESVIGAEHRLDSDALPSYQRCWRRGPSNLVRDMRLHVKLLANSMPAVTMHNVQVVLLGNRFYCCCDVMRGLARVRLRDASFQSFLGRFDELAGDGGCVDVLAVFVLMSAEHGRGSIVELSVLLSAEVDLYDIAFLHHSFLGRNAVD